MESKAKYDTKTVDDVFLKSTFGFVDKAKKDGKPFFLWHNTARMHVWTFLSPEYKAMMNCDRNYNLYVAGMVHLDDFVGSIMTKPEGMGEADNTILAFTTDNGAGTSTRPDGGDAPLQGQKGRRTRAAAAPPAPFAGPARTMRVRSRTG